MVIEWLGHAAFLIISDSGTKIITDPYESGAFNGALGYKPITISPDIVTVSHPHIDHAYIEGLPNHFDVLSKPGVKTVRGIQFKGVQTYHDSDYGAQRGGNVVFMMTVDHIRICHLGDLGHELSPQQIEEVGEVDILLIPIGGTYTLGPREATRLVERMHPRIAIPMHFKTNRTTLPLLPVDDFAAGKDNIRVPNSSQLELIRAQLPERTEIVLLKHAY